MRGTWENSVLLFLRAILKNLIRSGTLNVIDANGRSHRFFGTERPTVTIKFHNNIVPWRMLYTPSLAIGEGYMDGKLTVENGTIYDFLTLLAKNIKTQGQHPVHSLVEILGKLFKRIHQFNPLIFARKNVAHHYDLSKRLYELFLDPDLQYSCGYFRSSEATLEMAQNDKKQHLAAKLMIMEGQRILDIGSGWGGLAIFLAKYRGVNVTGVTLSENQLKVSEEKAVAENLSKNVHFYLRDYRKQTGIFDRIVSVGMFEHVGVGYFSTYFKKCECLLAQNGVALLHTIGRNGPPSVTDAWIRKYIFPGGYIPALSEVVPHIEKTGLIISDVEFLHMHYAKTIRHWRTRFQTNRHSISRLYDERFCKMWEFYLAASEVSFRYLGLTVFQIQMVKNIEMLPLTRAYIEKHENNVGALSAGKLKAA